MANITFGGADLFNMSGGSVVQVQDVAPIRRRTEYDFPGVAGDYRHDLGRTARTIHVAVQMVATTDAAMNTLEANLDAYRDARTSATLVLGEHGKTYTNCVLDLWRPAGRRLTVRADPSGNTKMERIEAVFHRSQG